MCLTFGIGGPNLLLLVPHTVAMYVEKNPVCHSILHHRMRDRVLPNAPMFDDITRLQKDHLVLRKTTIHLITIGHDPYQSISSIGQRAKGPPPAYFSRSGVCRRSYNRSRCGMRMF